MNQMSQPDTSVEVPIVALGNCKVFAHPYYGQNIQNAILEGTYEGSERGVLPYLLEQGDRVLEVGSAIGVLGLTSASIIGAENVIGFEANPKLVADAKQNFALNNVDISVNAAVLQNRIIWGGPGSHLPFYVTEEFWGSSLQNPSGAVEVIQVPTLCFEEQIAAFRANVLVCDIEGGEIELLEQADLTGIDKILMEIHYWAGRESVNRLLRKLIMTGFSINFDMSAYSIVTLHRGLSFPLPKAA
jgi:FkbM family methyltransferase